VVRMVVGRPVHVVIVDFISILRPIIMEHDGVINSGFSASLGVRSFTQKTFSGFVHVGRHGDLAQ